MELKQAQAVAQEIIGRVAPYCERIEVAGSIRRGKPQCKDIDIVLIPKSQGKLAGELMAMGRLKSGGSKIIHLEYKGTQVDFYLADERSWATLLLIRTGSWQHNTRLATLAKRKGWHLCVDGRGLLNERGERIAGDSEESFFQALGLPYLEPAERE